jgi:hypothetical protein
MDDMQLMRTLYAALQFEKRIPPYREIVTYIRSHPELMEINKGIRTWTP